MPPIHQGRPVAEQARQVGRLLNGRDRTAVLAISLLTVLLGVGFVLAPRALTGAGPTHGRGLSAATSQAFTAYWRSGRRGYPSALADLVAYWRRYHLVKAVFAVALTTALCRLSYILWRSLRQAGQLRPVTTWVVALAGSVVTALAFGSVLVVMATVQGTFAPFSSLVSLLPVGHGGAALAQTDLQIQHDLATIETKRHAPVTLNAITSDFTRYHEVLAAQAAVLVVILVALAVLTWRQKPTTRQPALGAKVLPRVAGAAFALLAVIVLLVCAANISTALNPSPALRHVFGA